MDVKDLDYVIKTTSAFRLLSDPTRFCILCVLSKAKEGLCVYEIADMVNISHSAASHQMKKLEAHGIVRCYRDGQSVCYQLTDTSFTQNLLRVMRVFRPKKMHRLAHNK